MRAAVLCVAMLGVLALGELGLRVWAHHYRVAFEQYDAASWTYRLVPGTWPSARGGEIRINEQGLRGPALAERTEGLVRIAAIGDSTTFGSEHEERTWPALLEQALAQRGTGARRYEVANASVAGATSLEVLRRWRSVVAPLEPDVVLVYVGWNDLMKFSPRTQRGGGGLADATAWLDHLWLVRGARKAIFQHVRGCLFDPVTGTAGDTGRFEAFVPGAFEAHLSALVDEIRASGARPVLVTLATPLREGMSPSLIRSRGIFFPFFRGGDRVGDFLDLVEAYNDSIRRVAAERGVAVADLARAVASAPDPMPWFWDTMHMNDVGQARMAEFVLAALQRSGVLHAPARGPA